LGKVAKAFLQLALFCDSQLKTQDERERNQQSEREGKDKKKENEKDPDSQLEVTEKQKHMFGCIVVENILLAMRYQLSRAGDRFPRLLELIPLLDENARKSVFVNNAKKVPCWMFIRWISQMMALVCFYTLFVF